MLFNVDSQFETYISSFEKSEIVAQPDELDAAEAEIRWKMYERIARGNALAEAEDIAHNKWRK
jgi:hypothetical protein